MNQPCAATCINLAQLHVSTVSLHVHDQPVAVAYLNCRSNMFLLPQLQIMNLAQLHVSAVSVCMYSFKLSQLHVSTVAVTCTNRRSYLYQPCAVTCINCISYMYQLSQVHVSVVAVTFFNLPQLYVSTCHNYLYQHVAGKCNNV
jgi:hypothetical protein